MSQLFTSGGQIIGSLSFSISPSSEYSGLISFGIGWFDLLAVQGTLKSLLQHHRSKPSILQCSVFFIVQLSHPYMTTRKTIALTRWTIVGKIMSLLFNTLSRLVRTFLPRSKCLLISCCQLGELKEFQVCRIFLMHILKYKRQKLYQWEETQGLKRLLIPYLNKKDN